MAIVLPLKNGGERQVNGDKATCACRGPRHDLPGGSTWAWAHARALASQAAAAVGNDDGLGMVAQRGGELGSALPKAWPLARPAGVASDGGSYTRTKGRELLSLATRRLIDSRSTTVAQGRG